MRAASDKDMYGRATLAEKGTTAEIKATSECRTGWYPNLTREMQCKGPALHYCSIKKPCKNRKADLAQTGLDMDNKLLINSVLFTRTLFH